MRNGTIVAGSGNLDVVSFGGNSTSSGDFNGLTANGAIFIIPNSLIYGQ